MAKLLSEQLEKGKIYTRSSLIDLLGGFDATINTGIYQPKDYDSIILFVTEQKTSDRTQYHDLLDGDLLEWDSQPKGRKDDQIIRHRAYGLEILVFYRKNRFEHTGAGFRYEGLFDYVSHEGYGPAHFRLKRHNAADDNFFPEVVPDLEVFIEGAVKEVRINAYERDAAARRRCIEIHGCQCLACGFDFHRQYGDLGKDFIHVHHVTPLSTLNGTYQINPETDMVPVCPNCHAIIHRRTPCLTIQELRAILDAAPENPPATWSLGS